MGSIRWFLEFGGCNLSNISSYNVPSTTMPTARHGPNAFAHAIGFFKSYNLYLCKYDLPVQV